jgi:transposase
MRGWDVKSDALFSYVSCEARVPKDHPLRSIQQIVDKALAALSPEFEKLYAKLGRPSIPPERLLRALLLQAFYSVRSELQLMEQLDYNLLFRWFVGLSLDEAVWDETVFTKNRERLIEGDIARRLMAAVLNQEPVKALLSDDHFSVDGTLIEAWASMKSFRPKDGGGAPPAPGRNGERDFHGEKRSNETHASTTDPDARLYRKGPGQPAKLAYGTRSDEQPARSGRRHGVDLGYRDSGARGRAGNGRGPALTGSRSVPTRPMMWPASSPICASTM